jgi:hypothetical protein
LLLLLLLLLLRRHLQCERFCSGFFAQNLAPGRVLIESQERGASPRVNRKAIGRGERIGECGREVEDFLISSFSNNAQPRPFHLSFFSFSREATKRKRRSPDHFSFSPVVHQNDFFFKNRTR